MSIVGNVLYGVIPANGGRQSYDPKMMTFDGSTGYYSITNFTITGNAQTVVAKINVSSFTGGGSTDIVNVSDTETRCYITLASSDISTVDWRNKVFCQAKNNVGTVIAQLVSDVDVVDGEDHVIFFSYNATTGSAILYVDGVDADNTGVTGRVLTTGTMEATSAMDMGIGGTHVGGALTDGDIGYIGYSQAYLTNPTDFYHPTNGLQEIDESGWTEWGSQPLFWNTEGQMTYNKGSAGAMTENGTITGPD